MSFPTDLRHALDTDPARFLAGFYTSFTADLLADDSDPAPIVDRYHTADIVQVADGHRLDRDKLIAHVRPVRKNRPSIRVEVHDALFDGEQSDGSTVDGDLLGGGTVGGGTVDGGLAGGGLLAARYTLHATQRGRDLAVEVCFFGRFAPDGRMRSANMLTRTAAS